eukprot:14502960-Ditylum_brightwellii.AAC.1
MSSSRGHLISSTVQGILRMELLNHLAKKYKTSSCEEFCLWSMSNIDVKTKSYLRLTALQEDKNIAEEDK